MKKNIFIKSVYTAIICLAISVNGFCQPPADDWFLNSHEATSNYGINIQKTYAELLNKKAPLPVVVAVIDSGIDAEHEDLKDVMWVNEDEIPNNGKDDDGNGYVDDIHGWNFIGGPNGENIHHDSYELTRLVKKYQTKFEGVQPADLKGKAKKEYEYYLSLEEDLEAELTTLRQESFALSMLTGAFEQIKMASGKELGELTEEELENLTKSEDPQIASSAAIMMQLKMSAGDFDQVMNEIKQASEYYSNSLEYGYNVDFDPRHIVGDDYDDTKNRIYGNNDIRGPDASHGTHVAGIIGATRNNGIGLNGVADNVRIMGIRAVPDGDEHDKDVANAIRYAVDNGASIINMSFGKGYSWDKGVVDKAVKYARKKDILLVHAAGNDGSDTQASDNYPNDTYEKAGLFGKKSADNWIEVGALHWQGGSNLAAGFSNYGATSVDIFAPGVDIYSAIPDDGYERFPGTSMASPMIAGVAAVLRSYFPQLKANEIKQLILDSVDPINMEVVKPGTADEMIPFSELCVSGGVVNSYKAVKSAIQKYGWHKSIQNRKPAKSEKNVVKP